MSDIKTKTPPVFSRELMNFPPATFYGQKTKKVGKRKKNRAISISRGTV